MNRNRYRLVFNRQRNAWLAVAETVRGRGKRSARCSPASAAAVVLGLAMALAGSALAGPTIPAANALPVPSSGSRPFVFAGSVNGGQPSVSGNAMTITTPSRALGLNWARFDIGSNASVTFNQPDATSRVLNRIWSADPSVIMGRLNANGEVYLINQNGILFGNGAQVNVGGLVASALNLSEGMLDKLLNRGLPAQRGDSLTFAWDGSASAFNSGFLTVDTGATINTPSGARVVLLAPKSVENLGLIKGGAGAEAILGAGGKVILTAPDDPSLRGLLVETQSFTGKDALGNNVRLDGSVTNKGNIDTGSGGVVTLAALAVNQKGVVNATRAVNLNGTTLLVSGTTETDRLTINQRGDVAEIDWVSGFNVGAGKTVEFVQQSAGAVAYNYVNDADRTAADGTTVLNIAGRSNIDGTLKANGQLVLINEKGFAFKTNARVSASNFVASALGMNPLIVSSGLLGQTSVATRAFYLNRTPLTYSDSDPAKQQIFDLALLAFRQATVNVESGATIESGANGYVILAGAKINQAGSITSSKGQAALAAGADLYLKPAYSAAMRGFSAEVNPLYVVETDAANKPWHVLSRGSDANTVTNSGTVTASLGDITLVGNEITQAGTLRSSTSATANGSIHLIARDQLNIQGDGVPTVASTFLRLPNEQGIVASTGTSVASTEKEAVEFIAGRVGGKLTLADGSTTVVDIDGSNGKTMTADQTLVKSSIDAVARQIVVGDADVIAKGGNIRFRASEAFGEFSAFALDPATASQTTTPPAGVGIFIGDGARIDASGTNAEKSVANLFIEVELRGDEFANNPVQRNGVLRGQTAWVDIRDSVKIADLSGWVNKVGQTVYEKAATGGTISFGSTGSVIVKSGAEFDVSGGTINYKAATVQESRAFSAGGKRYRLNDAPASLRYRRLSTTKHKEAAYVEGRSAGEVELLGHSLAIDGQLTARTTIGTRQREIGSPATNRYALPYGGHLIVKDTGQHYPVSDPDAASEEEKIAAYTKAQIAFIKGAARAAEGLTENSSAGPRLELSQSIVDSGFSRIDITSDGRIEIPADVSLNLPAGGSFSASGRQVSVAGDISAPSGSIALKTRDNLLTIYDAKYSTLTLASTAALSTAGHWINDYRDGRWTTRAKTINGGSISLNSAYDLDLREGSSVDVSGGGWVSYKKKLTAGDAGSITLTTGGVDNPGFNFTGDGDRRDASLFLDGELSGYALGKGGSLTIKTSKISFGDTFTSDSRNWSRDDRLDNDQVGAAFSADFVDQGGFFSFSFVGRDGVTVADNVRLSPDPVSWLLAGKQRDFIRQRSGSSIAEFAQTAVLHPDLRSAPTNIALATRSQEFGDLLVGENAYVGVSPQGAINLAAGAQLTVLGTLEAPAGNINLTRPADKDDPYNTVKIAYSDSKQSESIYLGPNSRLLAGGTTVLNARTRRAMESGFSVEQLLSQSAYKGSLLNGGTVTIDAGLGYLISRRGSQIDVSGATDTLNLADLSGNPITAPSQTVGSAGGALSLAAREGMFLDGSFKAKGGKDALGGSFALRFANRKIDSDPWSLPDIALRTPEEIAAGSDRQLTLYQSTGSRAELWPASIDSGAYLSGAMVIDPLAHNGKAALDVASLLAADFGSWDLTSENEMRFSGAIAAKVNNQVKLNAPKFSAANATQLALQAAAVQIGNFVQETGTGATTAAIGNATADIRALDIALVGTFGWNDFGISKFTSQGEIHFDSIKNSMTGRREYNGQMTASGDLTLAAARLSPATFSDFRVDLLADANGSISIERPAGASADTSLSAGGRLELAAATITHHGTISAPLGEVVFNAPGGTVTLGPDSVTSVAADRNLLFGYTTESVSNWKYNGTEVATMPTKGISIDAANTVVASGAKLDLSGGGDALAWEFTAGPGGKADVLAATSNIFAIMPNWNGFTATDSELQQGYLNSTDGSLTTYKAGDRITLAKNPAGLNGSYVLLPARYALLPGAYLVSVKSSGTVLRNAQTQADGSWLINASRQAVNADGTTTPYSTSPLTVELASSSVVANRAKYTTTTASQFFYDKAGVTLPGDAGRLTAIGRVSLAFDPSVIAMRVAEIAAADGRTRAGRGLELDLAAPKLLVSDGAAVAAGWSVLDQNKLNALGASSLLIGGVRTVSGTTTNIATIASDVQISNSGSALASSELLMTAGENLTVTSGSRIDTAGSADSRDIVLSGDGAFLRAAEGGQALISRTGSVTRTQGDLMVQAGASVSGQSLVFDATRVSVLDGVVSLGQRQGDGGRSSGGAIAIGAGRINVVGNGSAPADGLTLDNADLQRFATADQIRLTSYSTLDLYGNAEIGTSSLKDLVIAAAGVAGHGDAASEATIAAQSVSFANPNPDSASFTPGATLGDGKLNVKAKTITFADNATALMREAKTTGFALRGFTGIGLNATGDVRFSGTGVTAVDNDVASGGSGALTRLNVDAARVTTAGRADHLLSASGASTVTRNTSASAAISASGLGGSLELSAKSLDVSGWISAAAGKLSLAGTDYVKVLDNANVAAEGVKVAFDDTFAYAPGGTVKLKSALGDVIVDTGAVVSVSADAGGGDAGTLSLEALNGTVAVAAGALRGSATQKADQATLTVNAKTVGLDTLADAVAASGSNPNFAGAWDIRARTGNLNLSKRIAAEQVTLAADSGGITVGATGVIDASGAKGGKIGLYGGNGDVVLDGQLLAKGTDVVTNASNAGTRGQGGQVELSAKGTGKVLTSSGSVIDVGVAAGSVATGGKVNFRAAKSNLIANASDLNIQLAGTVLGASDVGAEIVSSYTGTSLTSGTTSGQALGLTTIKNALTSAYSAPNMALLRSHFGFGDSISHVRAGVEMNSAADFTIASDLDFSTLRFAGEAGVLTLLAKGNLKINNSISDGFGSAGSFTASSRDARISASDASWSYRLVAGADTNAAKLNAVKAPAATGNIEIAASKLVRTGTGDITLAAQGDITLKDKAIVYTAGRDAPLALAHFIIAPGPNDNSATGQRNHYLRNGGDLDISAGGSISQVSTGALTDWLVAYSKGYDSTQWWARTASFQQGFAAFGGGDIKVAAGANLTNVTAVIPTNGRVPGIDGEARPDLAVINGGGNLVVSAGGSINSGLFYAESGRLDLKAGKNIAAKPVLAMGNTITRVRAMEAISLGNIMNPMANLRSGGLLKNSTGGALGGAMASPLEYRVRIGTYGEDSKVNVTSLNGDVELKSATNPNDGIAPSRVAVAALNGSISAELLQMPGTSGQLDLLAANGIAVDKITQYDIPAYRVPSISNPVASDEASDPFDPSSTALAARLLHNSSLWHADDYEPSRLIALNGNINGKSGLNSESVFNEAVNVKAGADIQNLSLDIQHAHGSDVSHIVAGGKIAYDNQTNSDPNKPTTPVGDTALGIQVSGPGGVEVLAQGDIDLADTSGIVTRGNLDNPYLPEGGASILAMAGGTPNYDSLRAYLGVGTEVSDANLRQRFFTQLRDYGKDAQASGTDTGYEKGRALVKALFPTNGIGKGDIKLSVSQIKTEQGGDIHLMAPGGSVVVGVAAPTLTKKASQQGIFSVNRGNVFAYVDNNFLVNQSRVFTLNGGDIMIWADRGSIDAGSGSKTSISTPPPVLVIRDGQIVLDTSNSVSGSGIGVLASRDDTPPSDMSLFAPEGAIDAGDAGLRSTGTITLGAQTILNASNIQAAGTVSGAPAPASSPAPVAVSTSPTNTEKSGDAQAASALASNRETPLGVLTVEVLESGESENEPATKKKCDDKKEKCDAG